MPDPAPPISSPADTRVQAIFDEAAELPDAQREAFLDVQCGGDRALREEIEALLRHDSRVRGGFLEPPEFEAPSQAAMWREEEIEPGAVLAGRYTINRRLGEGGMGTVYLAQQIEPVQRAVAVKVLKLGMRSRSIVARFQAERQAMAAMQHPSIATVFDAGVTEIGQPFFVMEHVVGSPVTAWCDERRLTIDDRLRLFLRICDAVQHAHQAGVIHRDLKPSNILVTGDGLPKIIDFGVAKAIAGSAAGEDIAAFAVSTIEGQLLGTPAYMSPEQASIAPGAAKRIDTRSDVYSLGVLLYELLTGATPLDPATLTDSTSLEMYQRIREQEPPRPSQRLRRRSAVGFRPSVVGPDEDRASSTEFQVRETQNSELPSRRASSTRHSAPGTQQPRAGSRVPPKRWRDVRGDLDWITMKAIEKDPDRRYSSVAQLAADVQAHLAHEPVAAGPPATIYRVRQFARRHRALVLGVVVVCVLSAGWAATASALAWRETHQKRLAEDHARTSDEILDYLQQMLSAIRPEQSRGRDVTLREVVDAAALRLDRTLDERPVVRAGLLNTLGVTYHAIGDHARSEQLLREALRLHVAAHGESDPAALGVAAGLAVLLKDMGRLEEAESIARRGLAAARRLDGSSSNRLERRFITNLGIILDSADRRQEAGELFGQALDLNMKAHGEEHDSTLIAMNNFGQWLIRARRHEEAESMLRRCFEIRMRLRGPSHPDTIVSQFNLAVVVNARERHGEARDILAECVARCETVLGDTHPLTLKYRATMNIMDFLLGRLDEAEVRLRRDFDLALEALGPTHTITLTVVELLVTVVGLASGGDRLPEAEDIALEHYRRCVDERGEGDESSRRAARLLAELYDTWERRDLEAEWRIRAAGELEE